MSLIGRPPAYTKQLGDKICDLITTGLSLRKVCKLPGIPSRQTIHSWLIKDKDFFDQYARASKLRREEKFDELEDITDEVEDVQRARLKIDVIKWQLSKEEPKKYGDKVDITSDGEKLQPVLVKFISNETDRNPD